MSAAHFGTFSPRHACGVPSAPLLPRVHTGTLSDFLRVDLARKYPDLMRFVRVTLLQNMDSILTTVGTC
jgi:hypothetical protein